LPAVAGRSVDPLLPYGEDALAWHRRFNEVQMLFHEHPVNQAREAAGEPSINSVWFWGGGYLPTELRGGFACVWGNDPLARGLALATHLRLAAPVDNARQWLDQASDGEHLMVLESSSALDSDAVRRLEDGWFAPLLLALKQRRLAQLRLLIANREDVLRLDLESGDLWKFWRRAPARMS
jgi:hypothetical protein